MSSLLEQAIIDAGALKEAALKNAETAVLEKYSTGVKSAMDSLLEQDFPGGANASFIEEVPLAHENAEIEGPAEEELIEIDFDDLKARLHADEEEGIEPEASELMGSEETAAELFGGEPMATPATDAAPEMGAMDMPEAPPLAEEVEVSDELIDAIAEELTVDVAARLGGWASVASADTQAHVAEAAAEEDAAAAQSEEVTEEQEDYLKLYESRVVELESDAAELKSLLSEAKDQLNLLILENAKLLYQNKALNSASLNERQKENIVEAVRNASSVEETKMLFETLQSAVGGRQTRRTESLREVVSRPTTTMLLSTNRGNTASTTVDPNMDRMLRLAGLKQ